MRALRERLTYSNVIATVALFVALGGGAYALSAGEVKSRNIAKGAVKSKQVDNEALKGADVRDGSLTGAELRSGSAGAREVDEASLAGIGPGIMLASLRGLPAATGSTAFTPVGSSAFVDGGAAVAPVAFVATDLHVRLDDPPTGPSSSLRLVLRVDETDTALQCTIPTGGDTCESDERVRVAEGSVVQLGVSYSSGAINLAAVGWRAITP